MVPPPPPKASCPPGTAPESLQQPEDQAYVYRAMYIILQKLIQRSTFDSIDHLRFQEAQRESFTGHVRIGIVEQGKNF